jgi:hypothetical protein
LCNTITMKGFLLTIVSALLVILILNLGYYKDWFQAKPLQYWTDFLKEKDDTLSLEGIMASRYGIPYTMSLKIKSALEAKKVVHPVILFEPNSYLRDSMHIYPKIHMPEPAVFYYYTGLEGVWINSPDAVNANYLVRFTSKGVTLDLIKTPEQRQKILDFYKKFPPIL